VAEWFKAAVLKFGFRHPASFYLVPISQCYRGFKCPQRCANARPQPRPAIRESPISSRKAGSIRGGFILLVFESGPTRRCQIDGPGRPTSSWGHPLTGQDLS
jgi:hypothetical protein